MVLHKISDLLLRIELDIQNAKDALIYDSDLERAKKRMQSVTEQSKSLINTIESAEYAQEIK
jgi:hypothetical protein